MILITDIETEDQSKNYFIPKTQEIMLNDEYRMYGFVPYNISPIQKGIQFGHAVVEYTRDYADSPEFIKWRDECKTFIILDGGTTNNNHKHLGTLNTIPDILKSFGVGYSLFHEPDLGDQLTAVVFLVPKIVYDPLYDKLLGNQKYELLHWYTNICGLTLEQANLRMWLKNKKLA